MKYNQFLFFVLGDIGPYIYVSIAVAEIIMLEKLFIGFEKWLNKLETCVHQVKTETAAVLNKTKQKSEVSKPRANFG